MAYDEDLAERIRDQLAGEPGVTEKKMFGGLAFLLDGNMAVAASGQGGALVRVDPLEGDRLVEAGKAEPMVMRGRPMEGWLRVPSSDLRTAAQVRRWVQRGLAQARTFPPK
jgi:TfoX/Sxy family transcriptional regulator of competence genes